MRISELFDRGEFVVTAEVGPPKGIHIEHLLEEAKTYLSGITAVNVTDNQSSVMRLGSLATCKALKDEGLTPIFQLTCRDRNRIALQSDLLSAAMLGIDNVLFHGDLSVPRLFHAAVPGTAYLSGGSPALVYRRADLHRPCRLRYEKGPGLKKEKSNRINSHPRLIQPHILHDTCSGNIITIHIGQLALQSHTGSNKVLMILHGNHHDKPPSGFLVTNTIFLTDIL